MRRQVFGPKRNQNGWKNTSGKIRRNNKYTYWMIRTYCGDGVKKKDKLARWTRKWVIGQVTKWIPKSNRPRDRPRQRWIEELEKTLQHMSRCKKRQQHIETDGEER